MKNTLPRILLEEGLVLHLLWQVIKHSDKNLFNIFKLSLESDLLSFKKEAIKKYKNLFPYEKKYKTCGSYEYVFSEKKLIDLQNNYSFFKNDDFKYVLIKSTSISSANFASRHQKAQIEIAEFSKKICEKYRDHIPEHTKCKSHTALQEACVCPLSIPEIKNIHRAEKIGLSTNPTVKIQRVRVEDVKIDIHTTSRNKADKSIIYTAGWALKYDEES
jgi:hypothetical protein